MSEPKRRFLDVWIVESNTVYQEVPYTVVTDWLQQGRLLEDDMVRPSGAKEWMRIGDGPDFTPYLPHPEPFRAADQAEAMEAVGLDFGYRHPPEDGEDDPDMIPLIDVSLVLLVFFMMTATTGALAAFVNTPSTEYGLMADNPRALRVDISREEDGTPLYSVGEGDRPADADDSELRTVAAVLDRLRARLARSPEAVEVVINADKDLKARVARDLLIALRAEPFRSKISINYYGVSEKDQ